MLDPLSHKLLQFGFSFESSKSIVTIHRGRGTNLQRQGWAVSMVLSVRRAAGCTVNTADGDGVQLCKEFNVMS